MNDITPPKPTQQNAQASSGAQQQTTEAMNASLASSKTNVGKPRPFYKKRGVLIGLVGFMAFVFIAASGYLLWSQNKTYKIGNYSFGKKDVSQTKQALKLARGGTDAPGGAAASQKEAEDREVMLAALKSDADKNSIPHDKATLDASLAGLYKEYGGKEAYMSYMKTSYGWTPELVYEYRTVEYLKSKLQNKILMNKNFTVLYVRWDVIKDRDGANYQASVTARKNELDTKYKPFLESGQDFVKLSSQVEVATGATKDQTEKAYEQANGAPVILQTENPGDITYAKAIDANEGIDPQKFFATARTKGQVIGSEVLSDGRIVLARLESTGNGAFANWDDYLMSARKQAGLSTAQSQSFGTSLGAKLARVFDKLNIFKPQIAHALINCANHQVPVSYSFNAYDKNTGATLTGNPFSAAASRDSQTCSMDNYKANGYTVSGSGRWKSVTKAVWGTPGSITLDCVGYDWAFWAPTVKESGYTYHSQSQSGTYANGGSISVRFYYTKPATPKPTCTFSASPTSIPQGSSTTLTWGSNYGTSWGIDPYTGTVQASGSRSVSPTSSTTYTFVVTNSAGSTTCSAAVVVTPPPANAPTCTLTPQNTNLPAGGGPVALTWSSDKGTAWTMSPDIGQAPGSGGTKTVSVTTSNTYTYRVTNSTGTATCNAYITVGTSTPNCEETNSCPSENNICVVKFIPSNTSEISIAKGDTVTARVVGYSNGLEVPVSGAYFTPPDFLRTGGSFTDPRGTPGDYVATPQVTTTYQVLAIFPTFETASCTAKVIVDSPPPAPAYGPWLQSKRGNVLALGFIKAQQEGQLGSRPVANPDKEAEYVIMGYLLAASSDSNFCSTRGYNFGTVSPPACSYTGGAGYRARIVRQSDIGGANDPAITSLDRAIAARTGLAGDACTAKAPYIVTTLVGATLPADLGANNDCPVVVTSGAVTLNASSISSGRGTLYVIGDLTINGNINYSYAPSYGSVNLIPNLGIVVKGNITIASNVTQIDASLYATGKVKTCAAYPSTTCNQKLTIRGKLAAADGFVLGRNAYGNSPAELIIGSGLVEAFPPPGFVDLTASASDQQVITTEANPRF